MANKKLVVVGGGAAGFFCAVNAARMNPELAITLIEKTSKLLSKVSVSGGGRCNVTHSCFEISEMSKRYPRGGNFVKKTFHHFFTTDTINWFEERGVELKTEADGRMFPKTNTSQTIIDCLMMEAKKYKVQIQTGIEVKSLRKNENEWVLDCVTGYPSKDIPVSADILCIACGGFPKLSMFDWLKNLGHSISEPVPSLFTFNMPKHPITSLMGVSIEHAKVKIIGSKLEQEGPLLITHWGLSGPVILKLSAWGARELAAVNWQFKITVNWIPELNEPETRTRIQAIRFEQASQRIGGRNSFGLPQRLWEFLLDHSGIKADTRWADLPAKEQNMLIKQLCAFEFNINGKTTFKEEFVTAGGIQLSEVDANSMMSRKHENLFFAGEILDVDGITGGYNFQHAWTSGYIAAKALSAR